MTTPRRPHRRPGWALLLAVAAATLGGALAVRASKRGRTAPPAPPPRPATTVSAAPRSRAARWGSPPCDPSRSLVRMAIGAAVVVVLAIATAIATAPPADDVAPPRVLLTQAVLPLGSSIPVEVRGPAGQTQSVLLTGDNGARVQAGVERFLDQQLDGDSVTRNLFVKVRLFNAGRVGIDVRLGEGWVADQTDVRWRAHPMWSSMGERPDDRDSRLDPAREMDLIVGFQPPRHSVLTRLHLVLDLGDAIRTAEWYL